MRNLDLYSLSYAFYSPLQSSIAVSDNFIYVNLFAEDYYESLYSITAVYLESYKDSRLISRWPLEEFEYDPDMPRDVSGEYHLQAEAEPTKDYNTLSLVVTFSDGRSFNKITTF